MASFNRFFANHFGGCKLVGIGFDPHRNRDVKLFMIPGEVEVLGVSDGVDTWVAPTSSPFLEPVTKAVRAFVGGDHDVVFPIELNREGRAPIKRARTRVLVESEVIPQPRPRTRVLVNPGESQGSPRRRVRIE